jgi:hypothetical protein
MLAFFYRGIILICMREPRECISVERGERVGDLLDGLRLEEATGEVAVNGFVFKVEEVLQPKETPSFDSPYVSTFGRKEGLTDGTQVVTSDDFMGFIVETYRKGSLDNERVTSQEALDLMAGVFPGGNFNQSTKLKSEGLSWLINFTREGKNETETGVNPHAVLALFKLPSEDKILDQAIHFQPVQAKIWLSLAKHLHESLGPS